MQEKLLNTDQLLSTEELAKHTGFTTRFWEARRISGNTPPYIALSRRAVRYRWGDVCKWLDKYTKTNTSNQDAFLAVNPNNLNSKG